MVIAWTALFHSIFLRGKVKPFYVKARRGRYVRYEKIDGDYKAWELSECIQQYYKDKIPPLRKNLEFFVGLRNKIEHRSMPQLDDQIFGECQALLLNFEALLNKEYSDQYSLNGAWPFRYNSQLSLLRGRRERFGICKARTTRL